MISALQLICDILLTVAALSFISIIIMASVGLVCSSDWLDRIFEQTMKVSLLMTMVPMVIAAAMACIVAIWQ